MSNSTTKKKRPESKGETISSINYADLIEVSDWLRREVVLGEEKKPVMYKVQTHKRFQRTLFIRTKHNLHVFGVISFIKLQNILPNTGQENNIAQPKTEKWFGFPFLSSFFLLLFLKPFNCCLSVVL